MEDTKQSPESPHSVFNGMPCGKLGGATVSRLVFDGNPLVGNVHSRDLKYVRRLAQTYNTPECLQETLRLAEANGINTVLGWGEECVERYNASGGKMQFIARLSPTLPDDKLVDAIKRNIDSGAIAHFTDPRETDELVRNSGIAPLAKVIEAAAGFDLPIGVGTWALPVVMGCEASDLPLDFYVQVLSFRRLSHVAPDAARGSRGVHPTHAGLFRQHLVCSSRPGHRSVPVDYQTVAGDQGAGCRRN